MHDQCSRPATILVLYDDPATQRTVADYLDEHCLRAVCVSRLDEAGPHFARRELSLAILDLTCRHGDGLDLLRGIRSRSDIPVIISGGDECDEIDRVVALDLGADDFLTKPFGLRELLARIRAILRRQRVERMASPAPAHDGYRFGDWRLNRRLRRLTNPQGSPVALTKGEYDLLIAFLEAPQRPLSREHLMQATRAHADVNDRSIDVQVLRLRRKLEADRATPRVITTVRGMGYVFSLPVETVGPR